MSTKNSDVLLYYDDMCYLYLHQVSENNISLLKNKQKECFIDIILSQTHLEIIIHYN